MKYPIPDSHCKREIQAESGLPETERKVFLCRYWYLDSVKEIAAYFGFTESKVASMLLRLRKRLRAHLEKEGSL